MVTPLQIVELLAALSIPLGIYWIASQIRSVRWMYLVQAIVVVTFPGLFLLAVEDVIPNVAAAVFAGLLFGHITTQLDTD